MTINLKNYIYSFKNLFSYYLDYTNSYKLFKK